MLIGAVTVPPGTASGQATIQLGAPGTATPVSIAVTAPNGSKKTYRITTNRLSGDNNLKELTITPGTFNHPFDPGITDYIVAVETSVEEVTVTATKSDLNAAMSGSVNAGAGIPTGSAPIALGGPGSETNVVITVAATDPNVIPKTYSIIVKRAAPSSDNNLSALSLTANSIPLVLTPTFDPNHLDYTVEVPFGVIEVTVTAIKSDPNATMMINGQGSSSGQATIFFIFLPPPQVSITVTAPNGSSKVYAVTVNQVVLPPPPFP
jgi:hypothetical protein